MDRASRTRRRLVLAALAGLLVAAAAVVLVARGGDQPTAVRRPAAEPRLDAASGAAADPTGAAAAVEAARSAASADPPRPATLADPQSPQAAAHPTCPKLVEQQLPDHPIYLDGGSIDVHFPGGSRAEVPLGTIDASCTDFWTWYESGRRGGKPADVTAQYQTVLVCEVADGLRWVGTADLGGDPTACDGSRTWHVITPLDALATYDACHRCDFSGMDLTNVDMRRGGLPDPSHPTVIDDSSFALAKLVNTRFVFALGARLRFDGATIRDSTFAWGRLDQPSFRPYTSKYHPTPTPTSIVRTNLGGAGLVDADLSGARLHDVGLAGHLYGCTKAQGTVMLASLGADASTITFDPGGIPPQTVAPAAGGPCDRPLAGAVVDLRVLPAAKQIDLSGVVAYVAPDGAGVLADGDLAGAKLAGVSFIGAAPDFSTADFTRAVLDGADLAHVRFSPAAPSRKPPTTTTTTTAPAAPGRRAAVFDHASLVGADLTGASLQHADLAHADLRQAHLNLADLSAADLQEAVLGTRADGTDAADLTQVYAFDTSFRGVQATKVKFRFAHLHQASFPDATLVDADFEATMAAAADFTGAVLSGADLQRSQCVNCNFSHSSLGGADLTDAVLLGAAFDGVLDVTNLKLAGAIVVSPSGATTWQAELPRWEDPAIVMIAARGLPTDSRLALVASCPSGAQPWTSQSGASQGCNGKLVSTTPMPRGCTAAGPYRCPDEIEEVRLPAGVEAVAVTTDPTTGSLAVLDRAGKVVLLPQDGAAPRTVAIAGAVAPSDLVAAPDGRLLVADRGAHRVVALDPASGAVSPVAGTGTAGFAGDGGPAPAAELRGPAGLWVSATGDLYISDPDDHRVRCVRRDGTIVTVAGTGGAGTIAKPGVATASPLTEPLGLSGDRWGTLYIADAGASRVVSVDLAGTMAPVAGTGTAGYDDDFPFADAAKSAATTLFDRPTDVLVADVQSVNEASTAAPWTLFVADTGNHQVRPVNSVRGVESAVAGSTDAGDDGDGGPAPDAHLTSPGGLWADPGGKAIYLVDASTGRVRVMRPPAR